MTKFQTISGSLYEVDDENNQVRRLIGIQDPTPRQGKDGEWKKFNEHSPIVIGEPVLFIWNVDIEPEEFIARTTLTSVIKAIINEHN